MEAELDYTKSAQQNAEAYFEKAKEAKKKLEGAEQAIKRLEQKMNELEKERVVSKQLQKKEEREWYEKFYWFLTSNDTLVIGGRSAQQNELINSKYFDANDLFFHANVFGASVVVLKNGISASDEIKNEAAQFAASFSKAWEQGLSAVDVFSAKREQVSKSQSGGYLGTGSFLISGEREWFRNVKLELFACVRELEGIKGKKNVFNVAPAATYQTLSGKDGIRLRPGERKKSDVAKIIGKKFDISDLDYIIQHLPPGSFSVDKS